jgi:hypothetical protein
MKKLSKLSLRKLIIKEMQKMEEDALLKKHNVAHDFKTGNHINCSDCGAAMEENQPSCHECGSMMYEGMSSCSECGSKMMYEGECGECGYTMEEEETRKQYAQLNEGDCGCGTVDYEVLDHDEDDDFIPDHMEDLNYMHPTHGKRKVSDITMLDPDSAFGVGFEAGASGVFDEDGDVKIGNHKHYKGSYMAKNHMYKTAKYAQKLYHMIPDGHNLEDWMRSKLAQIADDISEVYHALDHDIFEGDV